MDPLAEDNAGWSSYNYTLNNPLKYIDPDGQNGWDIIQGAVDAFSNNVYGVDKSSLSEVSSEGDYKAGKLVGNVVSGIFGLAEITSGFTGLVGSGITEVGTGGVATPIAISAAVVSVAEIGHGSMVLYNTANNISKDYSQTYNGKKTDQYGNELGGSGKTRQNTVEHSTKKGAKDSARNEGKGNPVKHNNPKKGNSHYHPVDRNGEKKPNSTHHEYPKKNR